MPVTKKKHECLLCLGSNSNGMTHLQNAEKALNEIFPAIRWGEIVSTPAEGNTPCTLPYLNRAAVAYTPMDMETVKGILKRIESDNGRTPDSRQTGIVTLDIDLLKFDNRTLKPEDMEKDYVRRALQSLPR